MTKRKCPGCTKLRTMLQKFVHVDDMDKDGDGLMSNQGQGMDGYTKLANYEALVKQARKILHDSREG